MARLFNPSVAGQEKPDPRYSDPLDRALAAWNKRHEALARQIHLDTGWPAPDCRREASKRMRQSGDVNPAEGREQDVRF